MPSPDVTPYLDLTLFDTDAEDLVTAATDDATAKFPDWEPREGNTEVVLIEAMALEVAELVYALNRVPGAIVEVLLRLYGVVRDQGAAPVATATFHLADNLGHEVPAGTTIRLDLGPNLDPVDFTTNAGLAVAAGATQGTVDITATRFTDDANGVAAGTALIAVDAIAFVDTVELGAPVAGGRSEETGEEFLGRGAQVLRRLVTTLVLPEHFTAAALDNPAVGRATSIDNFDPGTGPNPGDNPGHITVAIGDAAGAALSAGVKTAVDDALEAAAMGNLAVHIIDPTVTPVAIDVTVQRLAGFTNAEVVDNVTAALTAYLDPATWDWDAVVRRFELISVIDQAEGVDFVAVLTTPAADVNLPGRAPLADAGAIAVTVNAP